MPKLHPSAGHEESRPSIAVRHSRLQAHVPRIRLQGNFIMLQIIQILLFFLK